MGQGRTAAGVRGPGAGLHPLDHAPRCALDRWAARGPRLACTQRRRPGVPRFAGHLRELDTSNQLHPAPAARHLSLEVTAAAGALPAQILTPPYLVRARGGRGGAQRDSGPVQEGRERQLERSSVFRVWRKQRAGGPSALLRRRSRGGIHSHAVEAPGAAHALCRSGPGRTRRCRTTRCCAA